MMFLKWLQRLCDKAEAANPERVHTLMLAEQIRRAVSARRTEEAE
jgi:hypothetical protein